MNPLALGHFNPQDGTPNWDLVLDDKRLWKIIWEQATLPNGTTIKRTRAVHTGNAAPNTPANFHYLERFG